MPADPTLDILIASVESAKRATDAALLALMLYRRTLAERARGDGDVAEAAPAPRTFNSRAPITVDATRDSGRDINGDLAAKVAEATNAGADVVSAEPPSDPSVDPSSSGAEP